MIESKEWNWNVVKGNYQESWLEPSIESYYLINRWKNQNKNQFLDLGCGLGRHTILFSKNGFDTYAFDLSKDAIKRTKEYAEKENLVVDFKVGDMLELPYENDSMDCILCKNVISHTDTEGIRKIIKELYRVLKKDGECYLTLCSKDTWGFKREDWPLVDENTKIKMDDGPEKGIPHFYADYELIKKLFKSFKIENIYQVEDFYEEGDKTYTSYHYHVLIVK